MTIELCDSCGEVLLTEKYVYIEASKTEPSPIFFSDSFSCILCEHCSDNLIKELKKYQQGKKCLVIAKPSWHAPGRKWYELDMDIVRLELASYSRTKRKIEKFCKARKTMNEEV